MPSAFCSLYPGACGAAVTTRIVSPSFPVTICEKISLSAGTQTYRTAATTIEIKMNAAHILLNAMLQINNNCLISRPKLLRRLRRVKWIKYGFTSRDRRIAERREINIVQRRQQ